DLHEQAIAAWKEAGLLATARSAYPEALAHFSRGLEALLALPDTSDRVQHELALRISMRPALAVTQGYASDELGRVLARCRELCEQLGESPQFAAVLASLQGYYIVRAEYTSALEASEELLHLA
ncbi:MAG: hypothetical protein OEU26_24020, partial [Candidatus Tectomicrobia bacterium]|nr:hypothetical protein [Candidatus Tectomicrobia bacterium]